MASEGSEDGRYQEPGQPEYCRLDGEGRRVEEAVDGDGTGQGGTATIGRLAR
jgi:hypothetical protein